MKTLTRIRMINWHLFENVTIVCNGTTYFIGVNGVGKSTILDAVQFALVGGQRDVRFNQAAVAGGKRTLASYVRGELGTEERRYLRGDATGVVALEFCNPDRTLFTHGAVIDAFEDGRSPEVMYFIVHNAALDDAWFFQAGAKAALMDTRSFKRHLEHATLLPGGRAQVFTRVEDYRLHLLNRLGQLRDTFPTKIVKGLAFSPLTDIRAFVHSYLLDENLVDVKTLQAQLETLRHFESLAADVRERIAALDAIIEVDQERLANRRRRITNGFIRRKAGGDASAVDLKNRRVELDGARLALARAGLKRDELAEQSKLAQTLLFDAQMQLQEDAVARRERELRDKLAAVESELRDLRQRETHVNQTLAAEARDAQRLIELAKQDQQAIPPVLEAFAKQPAHLSNYPELISSLDSFGTAYARDEVLLNERVAVLRAEAAQVEQEIRQLRTGDREASYEAEAPEAARLRRLLRAELGLGAQDVIFLCMALDIADESWQDAVEGVLAHNRFTLLVPPEHYDRAMRLYRERRHQDRLHGVGLLDTDRITRASNRPAATDSLAAEVSSEHAAARAFVDLVLGGYVKCDELGQLREHRAAVTRECFVRRNFTTSHLNPHYYRRWFIGARALPRQIEQREARLTEIGAEMVVLNERATALRERLALTRDKVRRLIEIERDLPILERIPALSQQHAALLAELGALDTRSIESLRAEVAQRQSDLDRVRAEAEALARETGRLEAQADGLANRDIPALEQAVEQAALDAQQFLAAEGADGMGDEVAREYERRRERQALETVLANATRYEGDYQQAESRARERMQEAKQAYSIRYDFGYDTDDDAARYGAERDKFVQSELPEFETRIAEQRKLAEQELVENFIHRLREQIDDARQQLDYLNTTLRDLRFGGERFEFVARPAPPHKPVYDMIMDSQQILGDSLFESDFRQKHQQGWDLLFERLTTGANDANGGGEALDELRELQDYRNYLEYDIRIHYPGGDRALLSHINAKKSGGETTTPFYVAMAASFAQAYRLNQPRASDTIRLALFDEAFSKMDTARTASALQFMRDIGLQVLLATPPDKSGALLAHVDCVRTVVRKDNHSFVIEIDKAEMNAALTK